MNTSATLGASSSSPRSVRALPPRLVHSQPSMPSSRGMTASSAPSTAQDGEAAVLARRLGRAGIDGRDLQRARAGCAAAPQRAPCSTTSPSARQRRTVLAGCRAAAPAAASPRGAPRARAWPARSATNGGVGEGSRRRNGHPSPSSAATASGLSVRPRPRPAWRHANAASRPLRPPPRPSTSLAGRANCRASTRSSSPSPLVLPHADDAAVDHQHGREPALRAVHVAAPRLGAAPPRVARRGDDVMVEPGQQPDDAVRRRRRGLVDVRGEHPPPPTLDLDLATSSPSAASQRPASAGDVIPNQRWNCSRGAGPYARRYVPHHRARAASSARAGRTRRASGRAREPHQPPVARGEAEVAGERGRLEQVAEAAAELLDERLLPHRCGDRGRELLARPRRPRERLGDRGEHRVGLLAREPVGALPGPGRGGAGEPDERADVVRELVGRQQVQRAAHRPRLDERPLAPTAPARAIRPAVRRRAPTASARRSRRPGRAGRRCPRRRAARRRAGARAARCWRRRRQASTASHVSAVTRSGPRRCGRGTSARCAWARARWVS